MRAKIRTLITWGLLIFIGSTLITRAVLSRRAGDATAIPDGVSVLLFHAQTRCSTCLNLEKTVRSTLDILCQQSKKQRGIPLFLLAYDAPQQRRWAEQFHVGTVTVILVEQRNGDIIRHRDLSHQVWQNIQDDSAMRKVFLSECLQFSQ